jgi:hypothetical protein
MTTPIVSAPQVQSGATVVPGVYALDKPLGLGISIATLASGNPLADPASGALDASIAQITFGALLYRLKAGSGAVDIYDGASQWIPEATFDPNASALKPAPYQFDKKSKAWTAVFIASALPDAAKPGFPTLSGNPYAPGPQYGFLSLLSYTDKTGAHYAVRSARSAAFGLASSGAANRVSGGALAGTTPTQDAGSADGMTIQVKDGSGNVVGELRISGNPSVAPALLLALHSPEVSIGLAWDGSVTIKSASQTTIDAPTVVLTGELHAEKIRYLPAGGGVETYL